MNIDTEWTKGLEEYQKQHPEMYDSYRTSQQMTTSLRYWKPLKINMEAKI